SVGRAKDLRHRQRPSLRMLVHLEVKVDGNVNTLSRVAHVAKDLTDLDFLILDNLSRNALHVLDKKACIRAAHDHILPSCIDRRTLDSNYLSRDRRAYGRLRTSRVRADVDAPVVRCSAGDVRVA